MRINFDIERERSSELYKEITNDNIDGSFPFKFHSQIELYFVEEGEVDVCIGHQRCVLKKNQMAVAVSYAPHLFRALGQSQSCVLAIPADICKEFTSTIQNKQVKTPFILNKATVKKIKTYVNEIKADINNKIKVLRRQAYGLPDDDYFFLRLFDASRKDYVRNPLSHKICD